MRRRVVAAVLVVLSLALLTVYFRESSGGGLHSLQSAGSTVLHPFEVAANRVAQPFRDAASWLGSLSDAKTERDKYRAEAAKYRQQLIGAQASARELAQLKALLGYSESPSFPQDYRPLFTSILTRPSGQFDQRVVVEVGKNDGVNLHDPVVTADGLVGQVTRVYSEVAQVTLITDPDSAVSVCDVSTGACGVLRHSDPGSTIVVDGVPKSQNVFPDDTFVTAGWHTADLASIYPKDIPVGRADSVSQSDTDPYKDVGVEPFANLGNLESVIVMIEKPVKK
jgi:rod shape-determining protein MreC